MLYTIDVEKTTTYRDMIEASDYSKAEEIAYQIVSDGMGKYRSLEYKFKLVFFQQSEPEVCGYDQVKEQQIRDQLKDNS
jgi:hypothetical protein